MSTAIFTIVTKSYLAYARALAHQVKKHQPSSTMYVLLTDNVDSFFNPEDEPFEVVQLHQLGHQGLIKDMRQYYSAFEFCNSLRPMMHEYMLQNTTHDSWLYLDSDIHVVDKLDDVFEELSQHSILLNPHCFAPDISPDPVESSFNKYGVYNGGFLGLQRGEQTQEFLDWFRSRLVFHCMEDSDMPDDQSWLNLVPVFFKNVCIYKHPGTNISFWNLHDRVFQKQQNGSYLVNDQPLLFIHFSGGEMENPEAGFSKNKKFTAQVPEAMQLYFLEYRQLLMENGLQETSEWPYSFSHNAEGVLYTKVIRRTHRTMCMEKDSERKKSQRLSVDNPGNSDPIWNKLKRVIFNGRSKAA